MKGNQFPDKETSDHWRKDPNNWVLGVFYYNKLDPRVLPPKRIAAFGWTINFANSKSIFLLAGFLALTFLIIGAIDSLS
ncbi:DUF5808 domain-containing protein [Aurantibacillus circumpalustris]|uniref:DUF5808 domain-containing protein n=1 Tax=Aurantibacillus circumpalustris TaxID=3036359 RepID=UPI00295C2318|nr:DUF5808 domain-containing protein [Aurantibacillus circumpalustris]